jgi:hypothetical protein
MAEGVGARVAVGRRVRRAADADGIEDQEESPGQGALLPHRARVRGL